MNYKHIAIIALVFMLALVVPASAVWSNGQWIDSEHSEQYFGTAKVVTDPGTGVTSKYNPITSETDLMTYQGHVYGNLKSGHVLEGGERFLVSNDLAPNVTKEYKFNSDGLFDDYFAAGNYTITLPQGTGSAAGVYTEGVGWIGNLHPEVAHINVVAGQTTYFTFIGNSVPTPIGEDKCVLKYTIINAAYCGGGSIIDVPAHTEYRYYITSYHIVDTDKHVKCTNPTHHGWHDESYGCTHYGNHITDIDEKVKCTNPAHHSWHYKTSDCTKTVYSDWSDVNPHIPWQQTRDVPATYKDVSGCASGVKESVQSVVDRGITSFLFDNRPVNGGIFSADGSELLAGIVDPASGIEKQVSITYNAGCETSDKTIEAMEYEVINL